METLKIPQATKTGYIECPEGGIFDSSYPTSKTRRGRLQGGGNLSPTLTTAGNENLIHIEKIMESTPYYDLLQPAVEKAKRAAEEGTYNEFLLSLLQSEELIFWDQRCIVFNAFSKYRRKPEGKGWCFDFENCRWFRIRKLTPRECFRLMDVKAENIDKMMTKVPNKKGEMEQAISNSQLYKCAGNSIVVAPMALCFKNLFFPERTEIPEGTQFELF